MTTIDLRKIPYTYDSETKTFTISERDAPFATQYSVIGPKTGLPMTFEFSHSTGPEFDKDTKWIYINFNGLILAVGNDAEMTARAAAAYKSAKKFKG